VFYPQKRQEAIRFSVERIAKRPFRASLLAFASVRLPGDVAQMVSAPVAGEIRLARGLHVGQRVERGDTVATIRPVLGQQADAGTLHLALKRAEAGLKLAEAEKARTEKLQTQNAISQKRLLEAEQNYDLALAEVAIAQKRLDQLQSGGDRSIGVAIKSTVEGRIVDQRVLSGAFVREGEPVLVISGDDKLWIQANLSSDDRHKMAGFGGIELRLGERALRYRVGQDATIISKGGVIDPKTRTVPVIFEVESAPSELPAGEVLPVRLFGLEERPYVAIPKSAVVNDGGVEVVYVQKDPEHFERREIETVLEDGDWVAIHAGVAEHERVVSEGAYRILLASFAPAELGHGHAH
jgi:RND family efflux transporter MFP subunit